MSDFKAKMHQIRFRLGLRPRPCWRRLQCSSRPLAVFEGSTSKRRERGGEKGEGEKVKGEKGRWCGGGIWSTQKFWRGAPYARPLAGRGREREGRGEDGKGEEGQKAGKGGREVR